MSSPQALWYDRPSAINDAIRLLETHGPLKSPHIASGDVVEMAVGDLQIVL